MTGATKSGMLAVDPNSYRPLLDSVKAMAAKYERHVSTFKSYVDKPGGTYWEGQTATAAQNNAGDGWKTIARIQDLDEKYQQTAGPIVDYTILRNLTNGQNLIHNAEGQPGVKVNEDLSMTYTPPEGMSKEQADKNAKIVADAAKELKDYGDKWWEGDQQVKHLTEGVIKDIETEVNGAAGTFDVGQAVKNTAPRTMDPNATTVNYKEMYPKSTAAGTDPSAIDPKVSELMPGLDPNATKAASALPQGSLPDLLDAASKTKPPIDPRAGSLADNLVRMDPSVLSRMSHVEKVPGVDPNSPAATQAADGLRRMYQLQGMPPAQIEAKIQETLKAGSQDHYVAKLADPNAPSASPSEHVSRDFGEQWNKFFANASDGGATAGDALLREGKELTGQAGPGAPGVAEAWKDLGTNTAKGLYDYITATPQERVEWLADEAQRAADNPGGYLGEKLVQGAAGAAAAPIGGEIAAGARGLLGDLTHGLPEPHTPIAGHAPEIPSGATHPAPAVDHPLSPIDPPTVDHTPTVGDHTPHAAPEYRPPAPSEFDPGGGQHYTSGDPHHPGGWPPGTPEATWSKGDTDPGWKYINHNTDKDWMPYQQQVGGIERTPNGALPEWVQPNPETGAPVDFDGHTFRGPQEVFLEAKDGFRGYAFNPDSDYWQGRADKAIIQVQRQLAALPSDAILEWHVSDPYGASALRRLFMDRGIDDVEIIYTPKAP